MPKNKLLYFLLFVLGAIVFLLIQVFIKYSPFLFRTPVYYCQHAQCSDLIKISSILGTTLFKVLAFTLLFTFLKTIVDLVKVFRLRSALKTVKTDDKKLRNISCELELNNKVIVVKHNNPFAFCLGFLKPKIVISTTLLKMLNPQELKAVLAHEKHHLEDSDSLTMFIANFIRSVFPFIPLFGDQVNRLSVDREIKADKRAVELVGDTDPLITTFRKLLTYRITPAYSTFPSFLDSDKSLEMRIKALTGDATVRNNYSLKNIVFSGASIALILSLKLLPMNTVNINTVNAQEVVACLNDRSCIEACELEKQSSDTLFSKLHPQSTP